MTVDQINSFLKHSNYYLSNNTLVNNPFPIDGQMEPIVSYLYDICEKVEYSVVIPIHNQEKIIIENIESIINNMIGYYEIIMIFDNCIDESEKKVIDYFIEFNYEKTGIKRILCINQQSPIFETSCDNIGFRLSNGKYIVEIQADMKMMTFGFNYILSKPFRLFEDVFSVSGRCTHNLPFDGNGVGKIGDLVEKPLNFDFKYMNKFFVMNTCNRGPLMFLNERLKSIGYLDEFNFVLGDDEHDANLRAFNFKKWVSGHTPVEFYSPMSHGSTRKETTSENIDYLEKRLKRRKSPFLYSYKHPISKLEIRDLDKKINHRL